VKLIRRATPATAEVVDELDELFLGLVDIAQHVAPLVVGRLALAEGTEQRSGDRDV